MPASALSGPCCRVSRITLTLSDWQGSRSSMLAQQQPVQSEDHTCIQLDFKVCLCCSLSTKTSYHWMAQQPSRLLTSCGSRQVASRHGNQPSEKWQRLSKAETVPPKTSDTLKVHAQAAPEDQA